MHCVLNAATVLHLAVRFRTVIAEYATYNVAMPRTSDTMLRHLAMLGCIPVYPRDKSTRRMLEELREMDSDYEVSVRSIQRNLERLSRLFPITCEMRGRTNYWYWTDQHALIQLPSMSEPTAFALRLAADHLRAIMPPSALRPLEPYFRQADRVLEHTALGRWRDKAAIIERGPVLKPPAVASDVQDAVYTALMENRKVEVYYRARYRARGQRIVLNPLGVVVRTGIIYLVATSWDYEDIRHYVLQRMSKPVLLDESARRMPGFRLSEYIRDQKQFSYPLSDQRLHLQALFDSDVGLHLMESRLGSGHRTSVQEDGRVLVEATVSDTADLRWWLLGFGSGVEVLEPESLRTEMRDQARRMWELYG